MKKLFYCLFNLIYKFDSCSIAHCSHGAASFGDKAVSRRYRRGSARIDTDQWVCREGSTERSCRRRDDSESGINTKAQRKNTIHRLRSDRRLNS